ncbi:MAG: hypothetical protein WDZ77_01160 [Candidatus Pacearchaeota archaeon]
MKGNFVSRYAAGTIFLVAGLFFLALAVKLGVWPLLIYGFPLLIIGIVILLNEDEDKIEERKDFKSKKKK